jgi:hypothetical protein
MNVLLRIFAVLFAVRGVTNVFKPFGAGSGMVFFGQFLPISSPLGPIVGLYLIALGWAVWTRASFALPMALAYAVFATINVLLFYVFQGLPQDFNLLGYLAFAAVAMGVPWATVVLLRRQPARA